MNPYEIAGIVVGSIVILMVVSVTLWFFAFKAITKKFL